MLRVDSKNTNFNAVSIYNGDNIASFNASVNDPGNNAYINFNIDNLTTAKTNISTLKADLNAFLDAIMTEPADDGE